MSSPILNPAIPQLPSGNLQVTEEFYRDRLGFTNFDLYLEHGHLIATRGPVEIHFWQAESEEEGRKYGARVVAMSELRTFNRYTKNSKQVERRSLTN